MTSHGLMTAYAGIHDDPEMMKQHADLRSQYENIRRLGGVPALEGLLKTGQAIRYQEIAGEAHDLIDRWNKTNPRKRLLFLAGRSIPTRFISSAICTMTSMRRMPSTEGRLWRR